jgi:hypothetical protein
MGHESVSEISFTQVRKLVKDSSATDDIMDAIDAVYGGLIAVSPVVFGPAALPLLALIDVKNELMKLGKVVVRKLVASEDDYLGRYERMAAANCLITYTSFFEALSRTLPELTEDVELTTSEKWTLALQATRRLAAQAEGEVRQEKGGPDFTDRAVALPHPAVPPDEEFRQREAFYTELAKGFQAFIGGLQVWESAGSEYRSGVTSAMEELPAVAVGIYQDQYLALAVEYPGFFVWADLFEHAKTRQLSLALSEELKRQLDMVAAATGSIDQGLARLSAAIKAAADMASDTGTDYDQVVRELNQVYLSNVDQPVIEDRYEEAASHRQVDYPSKLGIYLPQAYKTLRYANRDERLEIEESWASSETRDDLGAFIVRYLESAYSSEAPLLILGHPGSGKSLLTEILAARLEPPIFNTVRIELRDIDPETSPQSQIEQQIKDEVGHDVSWPQFASALAGSPPLIILDGYDELLQSSGKTYSAYLTEVHRFQRRERILGRPVRVIVTSRITLIDKAAIPVGTTVLRLLEFDERRRSEWVSRWNTHNARYFNESGVARFSVPENPKILQLAEQPLLLLMLAVYDSAANQLSKNPHIDQTLLYQSLLTRFIERERRKGKDGREFEARSEKEQQEAIDADLERLGVAAIGMFNRRALHVQREELDADIGYFGLSREMPGGTGHRLSQAELLLGSFFFIHESKSRSSLPRGGEEERPTAFEFLHNTFGEFLTADFILRQVVKQTRPIGTLRSDSSLASVLEQRLEMLEDHWFSCFIHTPLYTRPVILSMLSEWFEHRLQSMGLSRDEVLEDLDLIINRQIRNTLYGGSPPAIMQHGKETPYAPLPLLGHLATYSMNLILLRTVLSGGWYTFDETPMGTDGGCRPWDRLVQLWRSWLPLESLTGVAAIISASRHSYLVVLSPRASFTTQASRSRLHDVHNVAEALGDDLLTALTGLALHTGDAAEADTIYRAVERLEGEDLHLGEHWRALRARWETDLFNLGHVGSYLEDGELNRLPFVATFLEGLHRTGITLDRLNTDSAEPVTGKHSNRYEAKLDIEIKEQLEPRALPAFFDASSVESMKALIRSPAGAPILQAATKRVDSPMILNTLSTWEAVATTEDLVIECIDMETAASLAELATKANAPHLCNLAAKCLLHHLYRDDTEVRITTEFLRCVADTIRSDVVEPEIAHRLVTRVSHLAVGVIRRGSSAPQHFEPLAHLVRIVNGAFSRIFVDALMARASSRSYLGLGKEIVIAAKVAHETQTEKILQAFTEIEPERYAASLRSIGDTLTVGELRSLRWAAGRLPGSGFAEIVADLPGV